MGTPSYMAPEQFQEKEASPHSDQFSFCVALYEALYDERPFVGEDLAALKQAVTNGRVRVPSSSRTVPAWLRRIVLRGLSAAPQDRFPSMTALVDALEGRGPRLRRRILTAAMAMTALFVANDTPGSREKAGGR